jgi:hypothetical protein
MIVINKFLCKGTVVDCLQDGNLTGQPRHTVFLFYAYYWVPHTKFSKKPKTGFYGLSLLHERN